ncbi:hypothetical protein BHM03_00019875 [Ensete ventricosum]|nr:hypothetical protein BHM03_00019875 [Ensete ventricosum]
MVAPPVPTRTTLSLESQPLAMQPPKEAPQLQVEPNHTPPRDAVRQLTSTPSASARIMPDPDTLSSDSTDSLRAYRLPPTSIDSFDQLVKEFEANFLASTCPKSTVASLLVMRQKEDEPLGPYLTRFVKEIRAIPDTHPSLIIQTFIIRIRPSHLFWLLVERTPTIVSKMLQRANQYVTTKTLVAEKCEDEKRPQVEFSRGPPPVLPRKRTERAE